MTLAVALLLLVQAAAPVDLGAVLHFQRPANCDMGAELRRLFDEMAPLDPETGEALQPRPITVPGFAAPITPRFRRTRTLEDNVDMREVTIELPLAGRWHGLRVISLRRFFMEESDVNSFDIVFADPPAVVRRQLNRAGFRLPAPGQWRVIEPGATELTLEIGVHRDERGVALICSTG